MMSILRSLFFVILLMLFPFLARAQEVIATAGDDFTAGELNISWTLGELVVETFESGPLILTQGFHQPSLMITAVDEVDRGLLVRAFPNPAVDAVIISLPVEEAIVLSAMLFDASGRLLRTARLAGGDHTFPVRELSSGLYYLVVYQDRSVLKSFKIVKK